MARTPTQKTTPTKVAAAPAAGPARSASNTAVVPKHEQIAKRAYEIFLARGGAHGRHVDDWTQAERELRLGRQ